MDYLEILPGILLDREFRVITGQHRLNALQQEYPLSTLLIEDRGDMYVVIGVLPAEKRGGFCN